MPFQYIRAVVWASCGFGTPSSVPVLQGTGRGIKDDHVQALRVNVIAVLGFALIWDLLYSSFPVSFFFFVMEISVCAYPTIVF